MKAEDSERTLKALRAELERDTRVNLHRSRIAMSTTGQAIRLDGEVPDLPTKRIAANVCQQLAGSDATVEDHLCVVTEARPDRALSREIGERLASELAFQRSAIECRDDGHTEVLQRPEHAEQAIAIDVDDGIVELRGRVASLSHRRLAEALCWWVAGCRRVDNALEVEPRQDDSDDVLNDAVRLVLEADPLVDASQLRTGAAAGIVAVEGFLPNRETHTLALRDIWAVGGVWDVYDRIRSGAG
ncbi:MAG TPA: BON domain-containing protein [Steroidobacteraceae bacterium]|nr:BON domain-containing protein [Steroidobacteraceae bacterium]